MTAFLAGVVVTMAVYEWLERRRLRQIHAEIAARRALTPAQIHAANPYELGPEGCPDPFPRSIESALAEHDRVTEWLEGRVRPFPGN